MELVSLSEDYVTKKLFGHMICYDKDHSFFWMGNVLNLFFFYFLYVKHVWYCNPVQPSQNSSYRKQGNKSTTDLKVTALRPLYSGLKPWKLVRTSL